MKKWLLCSLATLALVLVTPAAATAGSADAPAAPSPQVDWTPFTHWQYWSLAGDYTIAFACADGCATVDHPISIASQDKVGNVGGSGSLPSNAAYTWDVTGRVHQDAVTFHIAYTGADSTYYIDLAGTIAPDGSMSGIAADRDTASSGRTYTWHTAAGHAQRKTVNLVLWCRLLMVANATDSCLA